jgi:hypothetical protein
LRQDLLESEEYAQKLEIRQKSQLRPITEEATYYSSSHVQYPSQIRRNRSPHDLSSSALDSSEIMDLRKKVEESEKAMLQMKAEVEKEKLKF